MRIVILTAQIMFVRGGAELLVNNLKHALEERGHEVEVVAIPFNDNPVERIEDRIIAARLLDIEASWGGKIDFAIGMKFPAYLIPHPNKVMWVMHQHRQAYDLYNTEFSNIKHDSEGCRIKNIILKADQRYLSEAKKIYTISDNVTKRMKTYCGLTAHTLYHPCPDMEKFYCGKSENYLLMPSRINITKRQLLAIKSLGKTTSDIKLYIVGAADNPVLKDELNRNIEEFGIQDRVKYFDFVSQEEKIELYANCRGVVFIPKDEDYGYITLEAMAASKPVITAEDSGGPLEFVVNGKTGFVCEPKEESIAKAMDALAESEQTAIDMGIQGKNRIDELGISWDNAVKELLSNA